MKVMKSFNMRFFFFFFSADFEHREQEKTRIEKAFRESDKRLGELVASK